MRFSAGPQTTGGLLSCRPFCVCGSRNHVLVATKTDEAESWKFQFDETEIIPDHTRQRGLVSSNPFCVYGELTVFS